MSTVIAPEIELSARLDSLHQLLYMRGGIRPVNAAVEELAKLLLIRIASDRTPGLLLAGHRLSDLVSPEYAASAPDVTPWKAAFPAVVALTDLRGRLPDGSTQPVWPLDEPFRISRTDVLAEALRVLEQMHHGSETSSLDPLGTAFDTFLQGKYDHAGGLGTYLTPATVARTMAEIGFDLVDPLSGGLVGDPCSGTGRFLAALVTLAAERLNSDKLSDWMTECLVGADQSSTSVAMARVNLLSYGAHHPHVFTVEDSITDTNLDEWRGQFKLILTNPPFGDNKYDNPEGIRRTDAVLGASRGRPKIDPAVAFVARCIDLLAEGGVAGIILPDGVLNSSVLEEVLLPRDTLLPQLVHVEGVISLPTATFAPAGTVAKTSILFVRKGGTSQPAVFLARANHVGHVMKAGSPVVDPHGDDLPEISNGIRALLHGETESSALVAECQRDVLRSLDASSVDAEAVLARDNLVHAGGQPFRRVLTPVRAKRSKSRDDIPFVSVLHVDELGSVVWHEAETYRPTTPGKLASAGDILISLLNPSKFRATVVPERYPLVQISAEFGVFQTNEDPYATLALLQHPSVRAQFAPLGTGTSSSRRRMSPEDVLNVVCPAFDDEWLARTGARIKAALDQRDAAARVLYDSFFLA